MLPAAMGAVAFQKGLGAIHALSHPIGAIHGTHHGTTNAVVHRVHPLALGQRAHRRSGVLGLGIDRVGGAEAPRRQERVKPGAKARIAQIA